MERNSQRRMLHVKKLMHQLQINQSRNLRRKCERVQRRYQVCPSLVHRKVCCCLLVPCAISCLLVLCRCSRQDVFPFWSLCSRFNFGAIPFVKAKAQDALEAKMRRASTVWWQDVVQQQTVLAAAPKAGMEGVNVTRHTFRCERDSSYIHQL